MTDKEYKEYHTFLNTTLFDVKEIFVSEKRWKQVHDLLYEYMKMGFEEEKYRRMYESVVKVLNDKNRELYRIKGK